MPIFWGNLQKSAEDNDTIEEELDARYLKLDLSNEPPTGNLHIKNGVFYPSEIATHVQANTYYIIADSVNDAIYTNASGWGGSGSDFAEIFESSPLEKLTPGDIVEISGGSNLKDNYPSVAKTKTAYSAKMIGVVTDRAAFIGGRKSEKKRPGEVVVGLLGRTPLKVSTVNGPIRIGDRLTSSPAPGIAIKASGIGPVIAFALEDFPRQPAKKTKLVTGLILAFVRYSQI